MKKILSLLAISLAFNPILADDTDESTKSKIENSYPGSVPIKSSYLTPEDQE